MGISIKQTYLVCSWIKVKILALIILLQYLFAYLKIPGPSIFWLMSNIKHFCNSVPKCLCFDIKRARNVTAVRPFPKKSLLSD